MRSVKTAEQLAVLRGERMAPDLTAQNIESIAAAMRDSTAKHEAALLFSLKQLMEIAAQVHTPMEITMPEKVRRWEFTCQYDTDDKLIGIVAEASE